ncbi:putative protein OS=Eoetvoesiella caeni OX=645616 GN=DFR37_110134 PE=4 SV=1 [Eoetvoesiella caeni]|uniref:Uncharacterized protein n=1 Tax=Eoetvoesiella caeni TaxID=645616 RepID=A0A366H571_9BURK|nr:hypothetical protein DFR37_110134 [Eoetvoesiella caeni]
MPWWAAFAVRCRDELAGGAGKAHGSLYTLAAGYCRTIGNAERRMARSTGCVVDQSEALKPVFCRHRTSR